MLPPLAPSIFLVVIAHPPNVLEEKQCPPDACGEAVATKYLFIKIKWLYLAGQNIADWILFEGCSLFKYILS